jgi:hypothetical protein
MKHVAPLCVAVMAALGIISCTDERVIVIRIEARPAVNTVEDLKVRVVSDGVGQERVFGFAGKKFPQTFSVSTDSLDGELTVNVEATAGGLIVASGKLSTSFAEKMNPIVMLEPSDFVVNTKFNGPQQINRDISFNGFQIASFSNGTFDVAFADNISATNHTMAGRRFSAEALPLVTAAAAGTTGSWDYIPGSVVTVTNVTLANNGVKSIALWDDQDPISPGVKCRSMGLDGAFSGPPKMVKSDQQPDDVSAAALANGNFLVVWVGRELNATTPNVVTAQIVKDDCTPLGAIFEVNTVIAPGVVRPSVAVRSDGILIAWIAGTEVRYRSYSAALIANGAEKILIPTPSTGSNKHVRVVPMADGYGVLVSQEVLTTVTHHLFLQRLSLNGVLLGMPIAISDNADSFSSATIIGRGGQEPVAVAWDECDPTTSYMCEIAMQLFRPNGHPVGDPMSVNTTTIEEQYSVSINQISKSGIEPVYAVGWTDTSRVAPDTSETAVRARVIYPPYNTAVGIQGADCRGTGFCNPGLACMAGTDAGARCSKECSPTNTCPGGGSCTTQGQSKGCVF